MHRLETGDAVRDGRSHGYRAWAPRPAGTAVRRNKRGNRAVARGEFGHGLEGVAQVGRALGLAISLIAALGVWTSSWNSGSLIARSSWVPRDRLGGGVAAVGLRRS